MPKISSFEDTAKKHGSYAMSIRHLVMSLDCYAADECGEAFDLDNAAKHLAVIVGHVLSMPRCCLCGASAGLSPGEEECLDAIERFNRSMNRYILEDVTVQVFVADGKDLETVEDPLTVYARHLRAKKLRAVQARGAREGEMSEGVLLN